MNDASTDNSWEVLQTYQTNQKSHWCKHLTTVVCQVRVMRSCLWQPINMFGL